MNRFCAFRSLLRQSHPSREEIVAFQNQQLRRLIDHAYHKVPYYRRLFDSQGLKPEDIRSTSDLPSLPITAKRDLQLTPPEDLVARGVDPGRLVSRLSSGASGEPLVVRRAWLEECVLAALRKRAEHYFGLRVRDKKAFLLLPRPIHDPLIRALSSTAHGLGFYRQRMIPCLWEPRRIIEALREYDPDFVSGFPGILARVGAALEEGVDDGICPRVVTVGGGVVTPSMRRQISSGFKSPVFETYGSVEFNLIAWECRETGKLHTCDDGVIVEVLRDNGPVALGQRGEVVATNLHSFSMPFIRYRLGDIVTQGITPCDCGQPFSTIDSVQGRMLDYFPLPGGRVIHPWDITLELINATWLRQYQLTQEREDHLVLTIVPRSDPTPQQLAALSEYLTSVVGSDISFRVEIVTDIPLDPSGKFRLSRSRVKSEYDGIW